MPEPPSPSDTERAAEAARRSRLARSASTEHRLARPLPRTRGWSHLATAVVAVPAAAVWTAVAPAGVPRFAVAAFAWGVAAMFVCSALLHLRPWEPDTTERLLRLDHTGIFLAIGGTSVAIGALGLTGTPARVLVIGATVGTVAGIVVEWLPFATPRGLASGIYLTLGWLPVLLVPWLWSASGPVTVGLLLAGGVLYTVGAVIVGLRRPDPRPTVFGYHEIFHLLVIAAVVVHGTLIAELVARRA